VFQQINIVVADIEASVAFYRLLGVEIGDTLAEWMPHHRSMPSFAPHVDADLASSTFTAKWNEGWPSARTGVVLAFAVSSRDEVDVALVEDPDGLAIGIASPPERRLPQRAACSVR
jgi:hypothetical protein